MIILKSVYHTQFFPMQVRINTKNSEPKTNDDDMKTEW